jgi:hypothetical protein
LPRKGGLIRCTVPGSTPNRAAILRTPGRERISCDAVTENPADELKCIQGRIHDGHKIILGRGDKHDKVQRWTLVTVLKAPAAGNAGNAGIVSVNAGEVAAKL